MEPGAGEKRAEQERNFQHLGDYCTMPQGLKENAQGAGTPEDKSKQALKESLSNPKVAKSRV